MAAIQALRCVHAGCSYPPNELDYTCPRHGELGTLDILYHYAALRARLDRDAISADKIANHWRYLPLLPLEADCQLPPLSVGGTPLYAVPRLAEHLGLRRVWVKDEGLNPTGSLKDRASSLVVARALQEGLGVVATASTGNAAAALAGLGAALEQIDIVIFVPASAPPAKIVQPLAYGAQVFLVDGSYDDAYELCTSACAEFGWYSRNTGVNPFTTEGKKTAALEIAEQLGWRAPDVVAVSVGDGSIISGLYKGFWDLLQLGWIDKLPRLLGVQAAGSAALADAWRAGMTAADIKRRAVNTIADSIAAELPRDRSKALRAVRETQGAYVTVSDAQIVEAIPLLGRLCGVFAEPAAAAALAGVECALNEGLLDRDAEICLVSTGNGLKDIASARASVAPPAPIPADLAVLRARLEGSDML
ncbi:MAG: threonine synthase [Chloroflexi bacterium]|nr:threonine synthase [Chloroflexota bacterium]MCY3583421.1 threonine synthase [Chloroflexota bacterium]MCY3715396.1 threonine synthase [Chloroflexota bacterium]MDE2649605.1 threonine synthase [Chloroflexota bacterium]